MAVPAIALLAAVEVVLRDFAPGVVLGGPELERGEVLRLAARVLGQPAMQHLPFAEPPGAFRVQLLISTCSWGMTRPPRDQTGRGNA